MDYVIGASHSDVGVPARPPVASFPAVVEDEVRERTLADRVFVPPGAAFHVASAVSALGALWAASSPSGLDLTGDPFAWPALACVALWAIRLLVCAPRRAVTSAFLVLPVLAGVVGAAAYLDVPRETRWLQAQSGFEKAVRALPQGKTWDQAAADRAVPGRIGSYPLAGVSRDAAGAVQFHLTGSVLNGSAAAFTYLVDGPSDAVRAANPGASFAHLHGHWYVITH